MLHSRRNMQGEARDEDTLGLAGLQGLPHPHPHHDQVLLDNHLLCIGKLKLLGWFHQHPVGVAGGRTS